MSRKTTILFTALGVLLASLLFFQPSPVAAPAQNPSSSQDFTEDVPVMPDLFEEGAFENSEDVAEQGRPQRFNQRMQRGGPEMPCGEGARSRRGCMGPDLLALRELLALTPGQEGAIRKIFREARKDGIRKQAEIRISEMELRDLIEEANPDYKQIEVRVRQVEKMKADMKLAAIKSFLDAKKVLTPEQVKKLEGLKKGREMAPPGGPPCKS